MGTVGSTDYRANRLDFVDDGNRHARTSRLRGMLNIKAPVEVSAVTPK